MTPVWKPAMGGRTRMVHGELRGGGVGRSIKQFIKIHPSTKLRLFPLTILVKRTISLRNPSCRQVKWRASAPQGRCLRTACRRSGSLRRGAGRGWFRAN
ncbi:hypothetical protein DIPPA_12066 [Diplonema papillatum]|nr:hypothetical protein DIPPA_12066 [Diplonema papillatum]